ncbi:MAG: hypothetical protein ACRCTE_00330 [Cellulosilyticaceae bacterium]
MDLFMIVFCLLLSCWSIVYTYKNLTILTKYKIAAVNFTITTLIILGVHHYSNNLWKYSMISWMLIPNIVAGSLVPIFLLILHTTVKELFTKQK